MRTWSIAIITLICVVSTPSRAEVDLSQLSIEELTQLHVVSVAVGSTQPISEAPAVASVLTEADFDATGVTTLEEALDTLPGIHVSRSGRINRILIRGISTFFNPQTLVLVNGIPITSMLRGDRNSRLEGPPLAMISRIEVIRGPGSALYGADAFAGVINIVTKAASDISGTQTGVQVGSFDSQRVWVLHSAAVEDLKIGVMAQYFNTSGYDKFIFADAQTALDQTFGTNASLAPGPMSFSEKRFYTGLDAEKGRWRLRGSIYGMSNMGVGEGTTQALDPNGRVSLGRTTADLTYHDSGAKSDWDWTSQFSFEHEDQTVDKSLILFPPGATLGNGVFPTGIIGNPEYWIQQFRLDNALIFRGFQLHQVRLGLGYNYGHIYRTQESKNFTSTNAPRPDLTDVSGTPDVYLPENSRFSYYGSAQDVWRIAENWELTAGLRFDHYNDFGNTLNPRAALVWKTTPELTTKFLYGRAFRAPSMAELYTINNPVNLGNPALKPEENHVFELAWIYQGAPYWNIGLNLFHSMANDLINFIVDSNGISSTAQNYGSQTSNGLELESGWKLTDSLGINANYSFVSATNDNTGKPAGIFPKHNGYFRADWQFFPKWNLDGQMSWVGDRDREPTDPRPPLEGYVSVDLTLRGPSLIKNLDFTASVRNLFDADIREPSQGPGQSGGTAAIPNDLPQAGRRVYGELRYRF